MAKRGNPNPKGSKPEKRMRDAILLELHSEVEVPEDMLSSGIGVKRKNGSRKETAARVIAHRLVGKAIKGDIDAIKEINNRVDGKATQPLSNDPDNPLIPEGAHGDFAVVFVKSHTKK